MIILTAPEQLALLSDTPKLFTKRDRELAAKAAKEARHLAYFERVTLALAERNCLFAVLAQTRGLEPIRWSIEPQTRQVLGRLRFFRDDTEGGWSHHAYFNYESIASIDPQRKEAEYLRRTIRFLERDLANDDPPFAGNASAVRQLQTSALSYLRLVLHALTSVTEDERLLALTNRLVLAEFMPGRI